MSAPAPSVDGAELLQAFHWMSAGEAAGASCEAYVDLHSGRIHCAGEGLDEEPLPDDIDDDTRYVAVPSQHDLDLGRALALRFVEERLPDSYDLARDCFRAKGAYSRFKSLLERAGQLNAWHDYEQRAVEAALRDWCRDNGLEMQGGFPRPG